MSSKLVTILIMASAALFGCSKSEDANMASDIAKIRAIKDQEVSDRASMSKKNAAINAEMAAGAATPSRPVPR